MKRYKLILYCTTFFVAGFTSNSEKIHRLFIDYGYFLKGIIINDDQLIIESLMHILYFFR